MQARLRLPANWSCLSWRSGAQRAWPFEGPPGVTPLAVLHPYVCPCRRYRQGFAYALFVGRFILRRSVGEKPILPSSPISNDVSADLSVSSRYRDLNEAAISTKNLSALVSQGPLACTPSTLTRPASVVVAAVLVVQSSQVVRSTDHP